MPTATQPRDLPWAPPPSQTRSAQRPQTGGPARDSPSLARPPGGPQSSAGAAGTKTPPGGQGGGGELACTRPSPGRRAWEGWAGLRRSPPRTHPLEGWEGRGPEAGGKRSAGARAPRPPGLREARRQAGREAALMLPEKPWRLSDTGTPPPGAEPGDPCQAPGASPGPAPRLGRGRQACRTVSPRPGTARVPPPRSRGPSSPLSPSSLKPPPTTRGSGSSGPGGGRAPSLLTQDTRRGSLGSSRLQSSPPSLETRWVGAEGGGEGRSQQSTLTAYKAPHDLGVTMAAPAGMAGGSGGCWAPVPDRSTCGWVLGSGWLGWDLTLSCGPYAGFPTRGPGEWRGRCVHSPIHTLSSSNRGGGRMVPKGPGGCPINVQVSPADNLAGYGAVPAGGALFPS